MIRDATPADFETILALNLESEHFLSPMSREVLEILHGEATYHRVVSNDGKVEAFLLAFREVGRQPAGAGTKMVSMQVAVLRS